MPQAQQEKGVEWDFEEVPLRQPRLGAVSFSVDKGKAKRITTGSGRENIICVILVVCGIMMRVRVPIMPIQVAIMGTQGSIVEVSGGRCR